MYKRIIDEWKAANPERFAQLEAEAKRFAHEKAAEKAAREGERARQAAARDAIRHSLVVASLPDIDTSGVLGIVAYRRWDFKVGVGRLFSMGRDYSWDEVVFADLVPTEDNTNGIYGYELSPTGLFGLGPLYLKDWRATGLIEMRGRVVVHNDGVLRAEWAKILCIFLTDAEGASIALPALHEVYPNTPVYVLNPCQIPEILFRMTLKEMIRRKTSQSSGQGSTVLNWKGK